MLASTRKRLKEADIDSVFLDLRMLESEPLLDVREAMIALASLISESSKIDADVESFFSGKGFPVRKFQRFLSTTLGERQNRTVLLFDDVDCLFDKPYRDGLFGGLRTIIDQKPNDQGIANIGFGFAHAQDPTTWIGNSNESPFNVAQSYTLREFSKIELHSLNELHGSRLTNVELEQLHALLGGHPFMTRTAFYRLCHDKKSLQEIVGAAPTDDGFFADHLRTRLAFIVKLKLGKAMKNIIDNGRCDTLQEFEALKALGMVKGDSHRSASARYGIYETYFKRRLDG